MHCLKRLRNLVRNFFRSINKSLMRSMQNMHWPRKFQSTIFLSTHKVVISVTVGQNLILSMHNLVNLVPMKHIRCCQAPNKINHLAIAWTAAIFMTLVIIDVTDNRLIWVVLIHVWHSNGTSFENNSRSTLKGKAPKLFERSVTELSFNVTASFNIRWTR